MRIYVPNMILCVVAAFVLGMMARCGTPVHADSSAWSSSDVQRLIRAVEAMRCR